MNTEIIFILGFVAGCLIGNPKSRGWLYKTIKGSKSKNRRKNK